MTFKFGDILINHYAGDKNPCKKLIYIKRSGLIHKTFCIHENDFWDMPVRDHRLEKVGSILKLPLKDLFNQGVKKMPIIDFYSAGAVFQRVDINQFKAIKSRGGDLILNQFYSEKFVNSYVKSNPNTLIKEDE